MGVVAAAVAAVRQRYLQDHFVGWRCDHARAFVSAALRPFPSYVVGWETHFRESAFLRIWALMEVYFGVLKAVMQGP